MFLKIFLVFLCLWAIGFIWLIWEIIHAMPAGQDEDI